ncbi:kinase-like domain-containing protein, partial [Epithele typhae]|uniref:kinase-like domain-containing protein n=1 Tax=Epithele typhae TaxID=378194 RepID=UPI00200809D9
RGSQSLVRRTWGGLCRAVAWMHSVGLVHRDIKSESVYLRPRRSHDTPVRRPAGLPVAHQTQRLRPLTLLCGSDSYAAPELVTGRAYDGRQTDAWACNVVLYALATRRLMFD